MWYPRDKNYLCYAISCMLIIFISDITYGLQDVNISIPAAVKRGENAIFTCNYDLENDTLYSVKWYKGRREFFRYTPKEKPSVQIFPLSGINVERTISNQTHILLPSVQFNATGKYRCEVSADAPSFHTEVVYDEMEVVEIPNQYPIITGIHTKYRLGDLINGNCSSDFSKPGANLTWTINGIPVNFSYIKTFKGLKNPLDEFLEAAILEIYFIVNEEHFQHGKLFLKCTASIYTIYNKTVEKLIEEDRPITLASGRQPDVNYYSFNQDDDVIDTNELLLQNENLKSFATSLSSESSILKSIRKLQQLIWINSHQSLSPQQIPKKRHSTFFIIFNVTATLFLLILLLNNTNNTNRKTFFNNINFISQFNDYKRKSHKNEYNCCCSYDSIKKISFSNNLTCKDIILSIIRIIKKCMTENDDNNSKIINKNEYYLVVKGYNHKKS